MCPSFSRNRLVFYPARPGAAGWQDSVVPVSARILLPDTSLRHPASLPMAFGFSGDTAIELAGLLGAIPL